MKDQEDSLDISNWNVSVDIQPVSHEKAIRQENSAKRRANQALGKTKFHA